MIRMEALFAAKTPPESGGMFIPRYTKVNINTDGPIPTFVDENA
jgi:hypothetical protein